MRAALWLVLACAGCGDPPVPSGDLAGALAVVGTRRLDAGRLTALRGARAPADFVAEWSRLELLAQAAEARGLVHEPRSSALVRRLLATWTAGAASPAEAQPDEIALARKDQWQRYDRGPAILVHHAVFMKTRAPRPTFAADAKELGRLFADRVQPDWDFERFQAAAKALPLPPGVELRAEQLPAFVEDGRAIEGPSGYDVTFASRSFSLQRPGDHTAPFETPFGVHVVQLEKKLEPLHPTDAEVRVALQPELVGQRVRRLQSAAIQGHDQAAVLSDTAEADMAAVVGAVLGASDTEPARAP